MAPEAGALYSNVALGIGRHLRDNIEKNQGQDGRVHLLVLGVGARFETDLKEFLHTYLALVM